MKDLEKARFMTKTRYTYHICYSCGQPTQELSQICIDCGEIEPEPDAPAGVSRSHNMMRLNERI